MLREAKDELICDLAETYHIYDMRALPVTTLAVLSCGLGRNSRVWAKLNGYQGTWDQIVQAMIADRLNLLLWFQTEDGHKGVNRPALLAPQLLGDSGQSEKKRTYQKYKSGADFDRAWEAL